MTALVEIQRILLSFDGSADCYSQITESLRIASGATFVCFVENDSFTIKFCHKNQINCCEQLLPRWQDLLLSGEIISSLVTDYPSEERSMLACKGMF